jgi:hypothetical protein
MLAPAHAPSKQTKGLIGRRGRGADGAETRNEHGRPKVRLAELVKIDAPAWLLDDICRFAKRFRSHYRW